MLHIKTVRLQKEIKQADSKEAVIIVIWCDMVSHDYYFPERVRYMKQGFLFLPDFFIIVHPECRLDIISSCCLDLLICIILDIFAACYNFFDYKDNALLAGSAILSKKLVTCYTFFSSS